jgi:hypothetical protein
MTAIEAWLHTRGRARHRDYRFLGPAPQPAWWREYAGETTFEQPTILVRSDGGSWQAYLSGIPSARRDAVGSTIRFSVVLAGAAGQGEHALALVACWLHDQDRGGAGSVSAVLDAAFPEEVVERLIDLGDAAGGEAATRVVEALAALPAPDAPSGAAAGSFLGDLGDRAARDAFLGRAQELLAGRAGRALVLNLVGSPQDVAALLDDARPLAVLAPELAAPLVPLDRPGATPGKAVSPRVPTRRRVGARALAALVTVAALTLAGVLAVVLLLL